MKSLFSTVAFSLAVALATCGSAAAQCFNDWIKTEGFPGVETFRSALAVTTWDPDGNGPLAERLAVGGSFIAIADRQIDSIGVFNPEAGQWQDIGGVEFLEHGKEGGITDSAYVDVLSSYQNKLIVGGFFDHAGGIPVSHIASWDGTSWSALGGGVDGSPRAMTTYNGELIVAGAFLSAGGVAVNNIARWNGSAWHPLGSGTSGVVHAVTVYNGELVAVGNFLSAGGVEANRIARWNGSQWQPLDIGLDDAGFSLAVLGDDLYVGGNFNMAGGLFLGRGVARWTGSAWRQVGDGSFGGVTELIAYQGQIIAGGGFTINAIGGRTGHIARLDEEAHTWHSMQGGFNNGGNPEGLAIYNGELIAVGLMSKAGNRTLRGIARWNGATQTWSAVAPGFDITPTHFTTYRGDLIAGGGFGSAGNAEARGVARWDGEDWHALGLGIGLNVVGVIDDLEVYNDELIVSGHFFHTGDGQVVNHIAAWNGDTQTWHALGTGVAGSEVPRIHTMTIYNGDLIAGGEFHVAGGQSVNHVARWDGEHWHAMGAGIGVPRSMAVYEGELYASVSTGLNGMQRWDGTQWHAVPNGPNGFSMTVFDGRLISGFGAPFAYDGASWAQLPNWSVAGAGAAIFAYTVFQNELIVSGGFEDASGIPEADGIVRFDGTAWHSLASPNGTPTTASGLWVHNDELITNGAIKHPDGSISSWRRWGSVCGSGDMNCDGVLSVSDIGPFVLALTNPAAYAAEFPNCEIFNGDLNSDGAVTVGDIGLFVAALTR